MVLDAPIISNSITSFILTITTGSIPNRWRVFYVVLLHKGGYLLTMIITGQFKNLL